MFISLLLLADEQENMIDRYIEKGTMYVLEDGNVKAECVVTDEDNGILEIKNIAVDPQNQGKGYGVKRHFTANSNITLFLRDLPVLRQFIAKKSFFYYGKITLFLKKRREDLFRSSQHNSISFIADNTISVSMCVLLFCAPIIRDFVRIKFNFRILPPQLP